MSHPMLLAVLTDLATEGDWLESLLADTPAEDWARPTPAAGWDVATTLGHLAWTDEVAALAATDPPGWDALVARALERLETFVDDEAVAVASAGPEALLRRWRHSRQHLAQVLSDHPADRTIPWFGPPMSATSMATARYMETWAHGLDVADALEVRVDPHDRVRHVVHLGVRTRAFSYANRGLPVPEAAVRLELVAPSGERWDYGPPEADQRVTGPAWDFALLVTQRRHRDDLALVAEGRQAREWLGIAQAFAGPPGPGRAPAGTSPGAQDGAPAEEPA